MVVMARPVSVSGAPDRRQVGLNAQGRGTGAESNAQLTLGEGPPEQTDGVVEDVMRRAPWIRAQMLRVRAAPFATRLPDTV